MSEELEGNWEQQRRTGRFAAEAVTLAETNAWLEKLGMPLVRNETYKDWADRKAEEGDK